MHEDSQKAGEDWFLSLFALPSSLQNNIQNKDTADVTANQEADVAF